MPLESLVNSTLSGLELHRAIFDGLDASGANFANSNLRSASFRHSVLNGVVMRGTALMNAVLVGVQMRGVDLSNSIAVGADFTDANLSSSDLKGADVYGASFIRADLCNANVNVKRIESALFSGAVFNGGTVWPEGFEPKSFGAIEVAP
ncbi:pentapeptide repeat-containing protein [Achromobacter sp. NCFB-sbj8-Ac1-l]|uniref:pentapeptide repeat-containing protein n=1 Tax=unclassified Achromobacter TaxID=2626865 RepID=UPI0040469554